MHKQIFCSSLSRNKPKQMRVLEEQEQVLQKPTLLQSPSPQQKKGYNWEVANMALVSIFKCKSCGKYLVLDNAVLSKNGKKIPLDDITKKPHNCPNKPFNKETVCSDPQNGFPSAVIF